MHSSAAGLITDKQVEVPVCFLVACEHQAFGRGITPPTISFHGNGFDIEKQELPTAGQMPENPADPSQNGRSLWVWAEQFALHSLEAETVFLTTGANVRAQST